jgi:hypothetical protein
MIRDTIAKHGGYPIWKLEPPYKQSLKPDGISIVMATYNKYNHIQRSLRALYRQEKPDVPVEIIVVNDGSTDGTEGLFKEHGEGALKGKPEWIDVRYFETGISEWTSPALSLDFGIKRAKYNYMAHSGADAIWYKRNMLKTVLAAVDIDRYLIFDYYILRDGDPGNTLDRNVGELLGFAEKRTPTLYPWLAVNSTEAMQRIGLYGEGYRPGAGEDDAMICKMHALGVKFCRLVGQCMINQEHDKEYVRDAKFKADSQYNVRLGMQGAAEIRRKIAKGELEKF